MIPEASRGPAVKELEENEKNILTTWLLALYTGIVCTICRQNGFNSQRYHHHHFCSCIVFHQSKNWRKNPTIYLLHIMICWLITPSLLVLGNFVLCCLSISRSGPLNISNSSSILSFRVAHLSGHKSAGHAHMICWYQVEILQQTNADKCHQLSYPLIPQPLLSIAVVQ